MVLTSTHNLCFGAKMKKINVFRQTGFRPIWHKPDCTAIARGFEFLCIGMRWLKAGFFVLRLKPSNYSQLSVHHSYFTNPLISSTDGMCLCFKRWLKRKLVSVLVSARYSQCLCHKEKYMYEPRHVIGLTQGMCRANFTAFEMIIFTWFGF